ncbi:MAG TPA: carbohydrate ABC transporter permease [Ilumatobacter sp.]|nr:carbohydrate ABC transporter permease [Ilumatobacter sp.]
MNTADTATASPVGQLADPAVSTRPGFSTRVVRSLDGGVGKLAVWLLAALWTIPTLGLFISSIRPQQEIRTNGWWNWITDPSQTTFDNYRRVLDTRQNGRPLSHYFFNTIQIAIPGALIPIIIGAFAAYAFSWMHFKGRDTMFLFVLALLVVPLQMCLIPLLRFFTGPFYPDALQGIPMVWFAHSIFGMPICIFLLRNFIGSLPGEVIEAARVDGAGHLTIFTRLVLPLSVPALASLSIFQFLWVWNDLLVAKVFAGRQTNHPMTSAMLNMVGDRGQDWHLLTAGGFVMMIVPLIVFLSLQRYFVRGLLAGSVKG